MSNVRIPKPGDIYATETRSNLFIVNQDGHTKWLTNNDREPVNIGAPCCWKYSHLDGWIANGNFLEPIFVCNLSELFGVVDEIFGP